MTGPGELARRTIIAATAGLSTVSPRAVARTARNSSSGGASLSRYPDAPASMASRTSASVWYVVRTRTRGRPSARLEGPDRGDASGPGTQVEVHQHDVRTRWRGSSRGRWPRRPPRPPRRPRPGARRAGRAARRARPGGRRRGRPAPVRRGRRRVSHGDDHPGPRAGSRRPPCPLRAPTPRRAVHRAWRRAPRSPRARVLAYRRRLPPPAANPRPSSRTSTETASSWKVTVTTARVAEACSATLARSPRVERTSAVPASAPGSSTSPTTRTSTSTAGRPRGLGSEVAQVVDEPAGSGARREVGHDPADLVERVAGGPGRLLDVPLRRLRAPGPVLARWRAAGG